jgi:uncharacterized protein YbjT (DUF2867 family)
VRLTIFAATGGIGRELLQQAVAAGHEVTAVARNPHNLMGATRTVTADLASPDPVALAAAVAGADAVASGLGPRSKADFGIASRGTLAILAAMKESDVKRIVVVSAAPVSTTSLPGQPRPAPDPGDGFFMRHVMGPAIRAVLRAHYIDLARMEDDLRHSGLDWTSVRPPRLTDKASTTSRMAIGQNVRGGMTVSRAAVAHLMLAVIDQPDTIGRTIGIAN